MYLAKYLNFAGFTCKIWMMQVHELLTFSVTDLRCVDDSLFTFTVTWCKDLKSAGLYKKFFVKVKYREIWFAEFTMLQMSWLCKLHFFFVGLCMQAAYKTRKNKGAITHIT